jgi:hypothetical protein
MPNSVFMPMLGHSITGSVLLGIGSGLLFGRSFDVAAKNAIAASAASSCAVNTAVRLKAAGSASAIAGPAVGISAFLLARMMLDSMEPVADGFGYQRVPEFSSEIPQARAARCTAMFKVSPFLPEQNAREEVCNVAIIRKN